MLTLKRKQLKKLTHLVPPICHPPISSKAPSPTSHLSSGVDAQVLPPRPFWRWWRPVDSWISRISDPDRSHHFCLKNPQNDVGKIMEYQSGWWFQPTPSEKYEFVSWNDDIPNIWKNNPFMSQTTNQSMKNSPASHVWWQDFFHVLICFNFW